MYIRLLFNFINGLRVSIIHFTLKFKKEILRDPFFEYYEIKILYSDGSEIPRKIKKELGIISTEFRVLNPKEVHGFC
ncbi:hypothetical protein FF021_16620 [Leptospira noguchii]|nr:hypothetical protein FF021_16620 [Leptospira noguchii]